MTDGILFDDWTRTIFDQLDHGPGTFCSPFPLPLSENFASRDETFFCGAFKRDTGGTVLKFSMNKICGDTVFFLRVHIRYDKILLFFFILIFRSIFLFIYSKLENVFCGDGALCRELPRNNCITF